ncbi:hypothetical protein T484DRAFT_1879991, partial [Baffinella frigidus]
MGKLRLRSKGGTPSWQTGTRIAQTRSAAAADLGCPAFVSGDGCRSAADILETYAMYGSSNDCVDGLGFEGYKAISVYLLQCLPGTYQDQDKPEERRCIACGENETSTLGASNPEERVGIAAGGGIPCGEHQTATESATGAGGSACAIEDTFLLGPPAPRVLWARTQTWPDSLRAPAARSR